MHKKASIKDYMLDQTQYWEDLSLAVPNSHLHKSNLPIDPRRTQCSDLVPPRRLLVASSPSRLSPSRRSLLVLLRLSYSLPAARIMNPLPSTPRTPSGPLLESLASPASAPWAYPACHPRASGPTRPAYQTKWPLIKRTSLNH